MTQGPRWPRLERSVIRRPATEGVVLVVTIRLLPFARVAAGFVGEETERATKALTRMPRQQDAANLFRSNKMLTLRRKITKPNAPGTSKLFLYRGDELIGQIDVRHASYGYATLDLDLPRDIRIVREEYECKFGSNGKETCNE